jgi:hypothetical protein
MIGLVLGDVSKHVGQISAWNDTIEFATADERIHCGCPLAPAVGAAEHQILASMNIIPLTQ